MWKPLYIHPQLSTPVAMTQSQCQHFNGNGVSGAWCLYAREAGKSGQFLTRRRHLICHDSYIIDLISDCRPENFRLETFYPFISLCNTYLSVSQIASSYKKELFKVSRLYLGTR